MHSDCGTTFKGADTELHEAFNQACSNSDFQEMLRMDRITWHYSTPAGPYFGGLWEAWVESMIGHLKRILGDKTPTLEELTTLLCQYEAFLNFRPFGPLHDDVERCEPLRPGHFLIGSNLIALPQPSLTYNINIQPNLIDCLGWQ